MSAYKLILKMRRRKEEEEEEVKVSNWRKLVAQQKQVLIAIAHDSSQGESRF